MQTRPLTHFNNRPENIKIDTIIIHSMTAGDACSLEDCCLLLEKHEVSAHYLITPDGEQWQCVPEEQRAWHAGASKMPFDHDSREIVNDFSIGIELITPLDNSFTDQQYRSLANLVNDISGRHQISYIAGHEHIAPGRKTDPGDKFDWQKLQSYIINNKFSFPK